MLLRLFISLRSIACTQPQSRAHNRRRDDVAQNLRATPLRTQSRRKLDVCPLALADRPMRCCMRLLQKLVCAGLTALTLIRTPAASQADHWRYHGGRWSYWSDDDGLWYYTDGRRW